MDKYIWILCIVLITFIFYLKFYFMKNNPINNILIINTFFEKNKTENVECNTPPSSNSPSYEPSYAPNSSNEPSYDPTNEPNLDFTNIIQGRVKDLKKINENYSYPINTQDSILGNTNASYNTINTQQTFEYNKKGILARIIPESIPINNQEKIIKNDYNPRIENFAPVDQLLVKSPLIESNYINQLDFPENTSDELPIFNADTVSQIYNVDNITSLYNTINSDIYKGYKTIEFI